MRLMIDGVNIFNPLEDKMDKIIMNCKTQQIRDFKIELYLNQNNKNF